MSKAEFTAYRKEARKLMPDITAIEVRYCWFACVPVSWIREKLADMRAEEKARIEEKRARTVKAVKIAKGPRRKPIPKWLRPTPRKRDIQMQSPDDMHGKARRLLHKLTQNNL